MTPPTPLPEESKKKIILDLCGGTGAWIFAVEYGIIKL